MLSRRLAYSLTMESGLAPGLCVLASWREKSPAKTDYDGITQGTTWRL
jgi:hypothetical protein